MDEMLKIIGLKADEVDFYVDERISDLNKNSKIDDDISLSEYGGEIYKNWINTGSSYLPSGFRSKGFKIDSQIFIDFIWFIKNSILGRKPLDSLRNSLNEEKMLKLINTFVITYFGEDCIDSKRKELYGYGSLNSVGDTLNLSDIKGMNVARCIEKSAALNSILKFLGMDSSLVLSDANNIGHAYCLVHINDDFFVADPNFYGEDSNKKGIPYIFKVDPHSNSFSFDPSEYGDFESMKVDYSFPSEKLYDNSSWK